MEIQSPFNTNDCNVTYMRTRTGPNWFRVYYKNAAYIRFTPIEVGRVFGIAKFTPSVNQIRDWCKEVSAEPPTPKEIEAKYSNKEEKTDD